MILQTNGKQYDLRGVAVTEINYGNTPLFELKILLGSVYSFVWANKENNEQLTFVLNVLEKTLEASKRRQHMVFIDNFFEDIDRLFSVDEKSIKKNRQHKDIPPTVPVVADDGSYVLFVNRHNFKLNHHKKRNKAKGYSLEILGTPHFISTVQLDLKTLYNAKRTKEVSDAFLRDITEYYNLSVLKQAKEGVVNVATILQDLRSRYRFLRFTGQLVPI